MRLVVSLLIFAALGPAINNDPVAVANDNRVPAGSRAGDTLVLRLTVGPAAWHILGDSNPSFRVLAFAEEGKAPSIPAPLLRVRAGTPIRVAIRNPLDDTLVVHGLGDRGALDALTLPPHASGEVRFVARRVGTYHYWGATAGDQRLVPARVRSPAGLVRPRFDSQLAGAFIVDPPGAITGDRVFVITELSATPVPVAGRENRRDRRGIPAREFTALNGRSWPHTERLRYALGDTVRWRIVNATFQAHPMHLHGFYFRVDAHGSARTGVDTLYTPEQRRMAVTEVVGIGETAAISWSPNEPGGWIFHCHLTNHAGRLPSIADASDIDYPDRHGHGDPDQHVLDGMNGLVLGVSVLGSPTRSADWRPERRLRLFVQSDSTPADTLRRFGYVLQDGPEPRTDSIQSPGPVLALTRGQPTSIEVVNRTPEPTSVHWHGIELESYYDGAVGWSGVAGRTAPAIRPGGSFEVRITPKRAGTFMYHTHFDELRQQSNGLVGALLVLEPGERWDPERDLVFVISDGRDGLLINGAAPPPPTELRVGTTYRLRVADVAVFRQNLQVRLTRDSSLVTWRSVAKDGFTLPPRQATTRPSIAQVASGETADFEITPDRPGELLLEIGVPSGPTTLIVQGMVRLPVIGR